MGAPSTLIGLSLVLLLQAIPADAASLRFYGHGVDDLDRVKIRIDDPALPSDPGPPADVGATDFTIEFWVRGSVANNTAPAISCSGYDWIYGNILFDRDRFNQGRSFGLSFGAGRAAFGLNDAFGAVGNVCGTSVVLDDAWHHVSIQRRAADGWLWLHVDGVLQDDADGPDGDVSYPDDGIPNNLCGSGADPCTNSDPFIVLGAEKHDAGSPGDFPSFNGRLDELRISTSLRYGAANFTPASTAFSTDASTAALYHFDEATSGPCTGAVLDTSSAPGGPSNGVCSHGGTPPPGPVYDPDSPFAANAPEVPYSSVTGRIILVLTMLVGGGLSLASRPLMTGPLAQAPTRSKAACVSGDPSS